MKIERRYLSPLARILAFFNLKRNILRKPGLTKCLRMAFGLTKKQLFSYDYRSGPHSYRKINFLDTEYGLVLYKIGYCSWIHLRAT